MTKKIVILYGGPSSEREVSIRSSKAVETAMQELGWQPEMLDLAGDWVSQLQKHNPDFVFLGLHGCPGEDGTVQGVLDLLGYPYQGSGVLASALAMDKPLAKKVMADAGLDVAKEQLFASVLQMPKQAADLNMPLPVVVKPASGGSSVGVTIVHSQAEWDVAMQNVQVEHADILVEEYIAGRELTVAVMNDEVLAVTEIVESAECGFYDYKAKYAAGGSSHIVPADLPENVYNLCLKQAALAHKSLKCEGVTRTDFRYDPKQNRLVVLEVNTLPGMTSTSLVPEQASYKGKSFVELVQWMVDDSEQKK